MHWIDEGQFESEPIYKPRFPAVTENMSIEQAAYDTVHYADGGAKSVAAKMGISHQVLVNKVGLTNTTHHLTLREVETLIRVTRDTRILEAMANQFGGVFVPSAALSADAPPNLINDVAKLSGDFGSLMKEVADDIADNLISDNELARVERDAANLREALALLVNDLRKINEKSKHHMD